MNTLTCSIIIPVYNNEKVLPYALQALLEQRVDDSSQIDIVICDDGSTDDTAAIARTWAKKSPYDVKVLAGNHAGSAAARNRGIAAASSELILFLGADIIIRPGALQEHLDFHKKTPQPEQAALGVIQWDPRLKPTPLMEFMIHGGNQNDYDALLGKATADSRHFFYGAFISLKRSFLENDRFSQSFAEYGWEDVELGRRLHQRGLIVSVLHQAKALHRHFYAVKDISKREQAVGRGLVAYQAQYPAERLLPATSVLKNYIRFLVIHTGGVWLLQQLVTITNTAGLSLPRLFLAYQSLQLRAGIQKRVKVFPT